MPASAGHAEFQSQLGHQPRIIPAIYIKPFVKGQKNDYNVAEAIAEAALRPNLRGVREKTQDQLDLQALIAARDKKSAIALARQKPHRRKSRKLTCFSS